MRIILTLRVLKIFPWMTRFVEASKRRRAHPALPGERSQRNARRDRDPIQAVQRVQDIASIEVGEV
jgi:hypothetical protein